MSDLLVQTGAALGFVLLLIAAAAYAYRKRKPMASGFFQLVAYHPFGPRRGVAALRVGREILVLGVTNTDMKLLRVLDASKAAEIAPPAVDDRVSRLRKIKDGLDG